MASVVLWSVFLMGGGEAEICDWIRLFHVARGA